jgi:hypothetical protein
MCGALDINEAIKVIALAVFACVWIWKVLD